MTRKLTREWLQHQISAIEAVGITDSNTLAAFKLALAAMDSEPVAWEVKGILCHPLEEASKYVGVPEPLYADPRPEPTSAEPVAWLLSGGGTKNVVCFDSGNAYADPLREVTPLYRHAQPAPKTEREPIAWLNDAYLARGVVDGEAGSEDAGPGYIPVYREPATQPAPVVPDERDKTVDADDHPLLWSFNEGWNSCRSAMLNGGKS